MAPFELEILIHYYISPALHPRVDSPAVKEVIGDFVTKEILEGDGSGKVFRITEKGRVWMQLILNTPIPRRAWIDENGTIL